MTTRALEDTRQTVISLMAGELIQRLRISRHRNLRRKRRRVPGRVVDRELVLERLRSSAGEPFDELERAGDVRSHSAARIGRVVDLLAEVGRLDDQRIPFPTAARVAIVL